MVLTRVNIPWSIPNAGPSVSVFHFDGDTPAIDSQSTVDNIRTMFLALASRIPNDVTISFPSEVLALDTATGELINTYAVTPGAAVPGTASGEWQGGSGGRIVWNTSTIRAGRRVRGSTFLVPLATNSFGVNGQLTSTAVTGITTAANALRTSQATLENPLVVYSRPFAGNEDVPARTGAVAPVVLAATPSVAATLRGRKY